MENSTSPSEKTKFWTSASFDIDVKVNADMAAVGSVDRSRAVVNAIDERTVAVVDIDIVLLVSLIR